MLFSYNWLKDYIKGKVPEPKKLAELLAMHSFEVEEIKRVGRDWVLDIDVLPNRAGDCLSHIGIAREMAVLLSSKFQVPSSQIKEDKKLKTKDFVEVEVKNKEDCLRYTAKVINEVKIESSPKWIQERLKACGLQPINNIVDITNYVMLETGQPIHAFDLDKVGKKIIVRRANRGEKMKALDDKTYKLDEDILVIGDKKEAIAIAGIKGGEKTGIDSKTKNIVIEAANFNQKVIRQGSRKLKLKTDASWRFENGIDPNLIDFAQNRVCSLIQEIAGGKVSKGMIDFYPKKIRPKKIELDLEYAEKLLGVRIPQKEIIKILKSLDLKMTLRGVSLKRNSENCKLKILNVGIPTFRLDISIQEDLIEEIGRIYGFQSIPSTYPQTALIPPEKNEELFWQRNIKNILKEAGFSEVYNYSFMGDKEKGIFGWRGCDLIELANPMSSFNKYLRPSLIPNLLRNIKDNLKYFDRIKLFEMGKIFRKLQEKRMLTGVLTRKNIGDEGFYEVKGMVDSLFNKLGISNIWYDDYQPTPGESGLEIWHPRKCAEIKTDGKEVGFLGEIHPKILENLEIEEKVFVFDLDFEKLVELASEEQVYQPISPYPAAVRDLAILIPQGTKMVEILNRINAAGGKLVRDIDLFDVYRGEEIPEGKENFAFHIIYQAENRTLSSKEIDKIHQRIIKALEENPSWEVRR